MVWPIITTHFTDGETKVKWSSSLPKVNMMVHRAGFQVQLFNTEVYALCSVRLYFLLLTCGTKGKSFVLFVPQFPHIWCEGLDCMTSKLHSNYIILRFYYSLAALFPGSPYRYPLFLQTLLLWIPMHKTHTLTFKSLSGYQLHWSRSYWFVKTQESLGEPWWWLSNIIRYPQYSFGL